MNETNQSSFVPQLFISSGVRDIAFYSKAFDAVVQRQWLNDDGSIHVAELSINNAIFHLHEESPNKNLLSPEKNNGTTVIVGLFVSDVDTVMNNAKAAGAIEISAAQDYDYGYRQGELKDPFGHVWMIEMKI